MENGGEARTCHMDGCEKRKAEIHALVQNEMRKFSHYLHLAHLSSSLSLYSTVLGHSIAQDRRYLHTHVERSPLFFILKPQDQVHVVRTILTLFRSRESETQRDNMEFIPHHLKSTHIRMVYRYHTIQLISSSRVILLLYI